MSRNTYCHYDEEFKKSCAKLAVESDKPIATTASELGVKAPTLYFWVKKYYSKPSKSNTSETDLLAENQRLKKELERVKLEREILKKASAYFAKQMDKSTRG